jgi:DNA-binding MarR family transcriptional regulator
MQASTKNDNLAAQALTPLMCARKVVDTLPLFSRFIAAEMRRQENLQISMPQLKLLSFLSFNPGSSLSGAAEDLAVTPATASNLVDRLVKRGYVSRVEDPQERRRVLLSLTESGTAHLETCRKFAQESIAVLFADLPEAKLAQVKEGLAILKEAFEEVSKKWQTG